MVSAFMPYWD